MAYVILNGLRTFYESRGEDRPILFIHGSAGNHSMWRHQLDFFGERYRAIAIDLMGHGKSEIAIPISSITIKLYAEFIARFLEALNIDRITLIGQSLGGAICISFCLLFPEKVQCLGLVNTGAKLGVDPTLLSLMRKDFRDVMNMGFENILGQRRKAAEMRNTSWVMSEMLKTAPEIGLADFEACNKFDTREQLSQIAKPTKIIGGSEDILTPPWYQQYLHEKIKSSELKIIEGAGHFSMIEKPEEFNAAILEFLERHL
ncbi:MAG: alpha/beta hydrolase [Candidatus Bathyarchaeota archaeon]|nr:MAG: alpha/beta hydrolase [Candidatus Bathyarchaeota archaeon]